MTAYDVTVPAFTGAGAPLSGLGTSSFPQWNCYVNATSGSSLAGPGISEIGSTGKYRTTPDDAYCGIIDLGPTANPRFWVVGNPSLTIIAAFDATTGLPETGLAASSIIWESYVDETTGSDVIPQATFAALGSTGLFRINGIIPSATGYYDLGTGCFPRFGSLDLAQTQSFGPGPDTTGDTTPALATIATDLSIDYVSNWQQRLRSLIYAQYKGLPNITGISDILAKQTQDLEDAIQSVLAVLSIDNAQGATLQLIAKLVGQPYAGEPDPVFRLYLKARIRANLSDGSPDDLYAVFAAMFGLTVAGQAQIVSYPWASGSLRFLVTGFTLDPAQVTVLFTLLNIAVAGGVRLVLEWSGTTPDSSLLCGDSNSLGTLYGAGMADTSDLTSTSYGSMVGALST